MTRLNPFVSRWTESWVISKSRISANRYIVFTGLILLVLLVFQIYWVIGNQVVTELGKSSELKAQIVQSQQEYVTLVNQLTPNEKNLTNPSDTSTKTDSSGLAVGVSEADQNIKKLDTDLDELEQKVDRYAAILRAWSQPWDTWIKVESVNRKHDPKFAARFEAIDTEIEKIDIEMAKDPYGSIAAKDEAAKSDLQVRLAEINNRLEGQTSNVSLENERENIKKYLTLSATLVDLQANKVKIDELTVQKTALDIQLEDLKSTLTGTKGQIDFIQQQIDNLITVRTKIDGIDKTDKDEPQLAAEAFNLLSDAYPYLPADELPTVDDVKKYIIEEQNYWADNQSYYNDQKNNIETEKASIENQISNIKGTISELSRQFADTTNDLTDRSPQTIDEQITAANREITSLKSKIAATSAVVNEEKAKDIITARGEQKKELEKQKKDLLLEEQAYLDKADSRPAQLAGQFVLNILQSYILPILYGLLGAGTSVIRSLSQKIKDVTYSRAIEVQHILSISLGALAGIMVGWFSFLIGPSTTTFLGSVSPLAIAFLVGYNIETFFSRMDDALKTDKNAQQPNSKL